MARDDRPPVLAARPVRVDRLALVTVPDADHAIFEVDCGKGFYIRSLARDLARALGTVGHVAELIRTRVGPFTLEGAISLAKLDLLGHSAAGSEHLFPVETALDDIPALALTEGEADRLKRGQPVPIPRNADRDTSPTFAEGAVVCATSGGKLVAFTRVEGDVVRPGAGPQPVTKECTMSITAARKRRTHQGICAEGRRHRVTRGPGRHLERAHQQSHRASHRTQQGPSFAPGTPGDGRTAPAPARLSEARGRGALRRAHQAAQPAPLAPVMGAIGRYARVPS